MAYSHRDLMGSGRGLGPIFTARIRSLRECNVFSHVCRVHRRGGTHMTDPPPSTWDPATYGDLLASGQLAYCEAFLCVKIFTSECQPYEYYFPKSITMYGKENS